jgi:peptidylprolyl isomerase
MEEGEQKSVSISPDEAYGAYNEKLVGKLPVEHLPDDVEPEVGLGLELRSSDGNTIPVTVTEVDDKEITLDGNHPLSGETLNFDLELVEIC